MHNEIAICIMAHGSGRLDSVRIKSAKIIKEPRPSMLQVKGRHTESVGRFSRSDSATRKTRSNVRRQTDIELVVGVRQTDGGLGLGLPLNLERSTKQKQTNRHGGRG